MMNAVRRRALDTVKGIILHRLAGYPACVYLFGSCARGDGGHWSDIHVAIDPLEPLPAGLMADIAEDLEESTVPYFVDVVNLATSRPEFQLENARQALARLQESLRLPVDDTVRDPAILSFTLAAEAAWKADRAMISHGLGVERPTSASPNSMVRESRIAGLLTGEQAEEAIAMLNSRNPTVHTYDEEKAEELFARLPSHARLIETWISALQGSITRP
ncbi:nucleotidyltransferase substrate binding protein [Azospirillum picis]|uniref:Nucleotidyltransferase substrate binding protein (TIGR01987 family) n=1 Tax=Azospirillum picis TaxID=488438 RepID=A0ABU0MG97_9PROT|nr:nucleotidyltransferase substrate binding protein [Azospirillum picis]MBP2298483.1 nucleotidyltransferase substrate binding protein (TIGR01987 family) [Azospirillum picis]MDQ0532468.1 nucleotidyltransferase substrate binding protein (TIGR01987 family) [Azospirillum picis]